MLGAPSKIDNNDDLAVEVCNKAVVKYNQEKGTNLKFVSIVSMTGTVVAGMLYEGVIQTDNGNYNVKLCSKEWENFLQIDQFEKI